MLINDEKWHYLAVKSLSALLRGITSNGDGNLCFFSCFHSYCTNNALKKHERLCNKHDYCNIEMPQEDEKIPKYKHGEKSLKAPFTIYLELACLLKKEQSCQNNPGKSYTERKAKHEPLGWAIVIKCSFDATKNKYDYYRGTDCIKKLSENFRGRAMEIINPKEEEMMPLTDEEIKFYKKQKVCHICKKKFYNDENKKNEFKLFQKVRDHCHYKGKFRRAAHSICNLRYKVPKEIPVVIHNGSAYDYHFIIKQLAEEFKNQFECLGENTEKYITFSLPIKKEHDNGKLITYKIKFIDSYRLCKTNYQTLLITCLELIIKNANHAWKGKKLNQNANLWSLDIID